MKEKLQRKTPDGPEGTVWFGGPVDRFKITLRVFGDDLDPDRISSQLGCLPTSSERKGVPVPSARGARIPKRGRWFLSIESKNCNEDDDVEDGVRILLASLPSDKDLWDFLTKTYKVDIFCGLFLGAENQGFGISPDLSKLLADRNLEIGFDLYLDPAAKPPGS